MKLQIITPEKILFEAEADMVQLPGIDGSFAILKNHAPMIAALAKGKIKVGLGNDFQFVDINGGMMEVMDNKILVLAD